MPDDFNMRLLMRRDPASLTPEETDFVLRTEAQGGVFPGELPLEDAVDRERCLTSPSYLATEVVDKYYKDNFEPIHHAAMDEVMAPYLTGNTVRIQGQNHDPKLYLGLLVLFSRDTFKSSMLWLMLLWTYLHWKIRLGVDARAMYVHQVIKKAVKRGENIRDQSRHNKRFRRLFPEFARTPGEWDTKEEWRWPGFASRSAGEWSFTAYGETSDKTGGHYNPRFVDDWETEQIKTPQARLDNFDAFRGMDPLKDRTAKFCPYLIAGTTYHYEGTHEKLIKNGGYLVWKVPAHAGSPKVLFDLASMNPGDDQKKIEKGLKVLESTRAADLNFPKRLDWRELYLNARAQGPYIFACQMLLSAVPEGDKRFDLSGLREGWEAEIPPPSEMWIYIRCDPAISEKRSADETAYVVGGVHWSGKRWLLDGWIGREKQPTKLVGRGFDLARKWINKGYTVKSLGYEAVQYQRGLVNIARYGIPERKPMHEGESIPMRLAPCSVVGINRPPDTSKPERIMSMDGPITRRELKFWRECPIAEKVMKQFENYPHDRDDALDAVHDLWVLTRTPPMEMVPEIAPFHPELMKLLRSSEEGDGPKLCGTNQTVRLTA